jgi:hypothetical protein
MVDEDESWRDLCAWLSDNGASGLDGAACSVAPATFNMVRVPCVALVARVGNAVDRESSLTPPSWRFSYRPARRYSRVNADVPECRVPLSQGEQRLRGLAATRDVQVGDTLVSIPLYCTLIAEEVRAHTLDASLDHPPSGR